MVKTFYKPEKTIQVYQVHKDTMNDEDMPTWLDKLLTHGYADGLYYGYDKKFFGLVLHSSKVARVGQFLAYDMDRFELEIMEDFQLASYQEL